MKFKFKETLIHLLKLHSTPHDIALGTAIGVFIAILPVYGLHTVMVIVAAIIIRPANKIAILLGTNISLPPTVPFITWAGYEIGRFILKGRFPPLTWSDFRNLSLKNILSHYQPLFLGSVILGIVCGAIFYVITYFVVKKIQERKEHIG